jgi:hypothetical protein
MNSNHKMKFGLVGLLAVVAPSLNGCVTTTTSNTTNPSMTGIDGPHVTLTATDFSMWVILQDVKFSGGLTYELPKMPHSDVSATPDLASGGLLLEVDISIADLTALLGVDTIPPSTLPGGRPLPGIPGGTEPAIAVTIPQWDNVVVYAGPTVFGVFVPVTLGLKDFTGTFNFFDGSGKDIGEISVVGEDSTGKNSGFLVLIPVTLTSGALTPSLLK